MILQKRIRHYQHRFYKSNGDLPLFKSLFALAIVFQKAFILGEKSVIKAKKSPFVE
jgi:hypothetical protein